MLFATARSALFGAAGHTGPYIASPETGLLNVLQQICLDGQKQRMFNPYLSLQVTTEHT